MASEEHRAITDVSHEGEPLHRILDQHRDWLEGKGGKQARLEGADLSNVDLSGVNLQKAVLASCDLGDACLYGADLQEAHLGKATLTGTVLTFAKLHKANLVEANLERAHLDRCDLSCAYLRDAILSRSNLSESDLQGADLVSSDFQGAILYGAQLQRAFVWNADFRNADLSEAHLSGCTGLGTISFSQDTQVASTRSDGATWDTNIRFRRQFERQNYLRNLKANAKGPQQAWLWLWRVTCGYGESPGRWLLCCLLLILLFGFLYCPWFDCIDLNKGGRSATWLSPFYFSTVTFTTLGFGDIVPKNWCGEALIIAEVFFGYVMLGGLITIFSRKIVV